MIHGDYIPSTDATFAVWHDQFKAAATTIGTTLGITSGDITGLGTDNTDVHARIATSIATTDTAKQATQDKNNSLRLAIAHARALAQRIKAHAAYTPALGEQLGIIGPDPVIDDKPVLKAKALPHGAVEVKFTKGHSDGVNIYSKRDTDADFLFLARDTASPYVDNRALLVAGKPETRSYRAFYVVDDAETGTASDDVNIVCV